MGQTQNNFCLLFLSERGNFGYFFKNVNILGKDQTERKITLM